MNKKPDLVNLADYGLKGINFYWTRKERFNLSEEELNSADVFDASAYVDKAIIDPLKKANNIFSQDGYELLVKDAYRSPELYKLVQKKRYEIHGKEHTDKLLNLETMPHSTGRVIDVSLIDMKSGEELKFRDSADDPDGWFIDFYRDKTDAQSKEFQRLQDLLIKTMVSVGFQLGSKREFWHFEFRGD